ncbi:MmcQ/YjbR family DNA-binding protein [Pseudoalteromonas denitrificans]|uniref:Predicted DNA-binding protein, MmcQ/YjbR family n=1 Tax=Pseudoalteromonas denitrificans DSM 6059 TaxID=1123010 RepID=A0A1I1QCK7_9GAMM|nr:MmcQ/YjbR family DNA-binding protein [Pseudoalteromonas denitrificans]SFD19702.1 Predicted DNA-binding protein, MmcQ/YjbR family [Pseudoalteromonas denitrificans DSM 6059]
MSMEIIKNYLSSKPEAKIEHPFGDEVMVFKVKNKMFATLSIGKMGKGDGEAQDWWVNLKCDPDEALALRDIFDAVIPGYHMNKRLWNTVILNGSIPQGELERMMDNSYMLVVNNMPTKDREAIELQL